MASVALISDIHGNYTALQAVLADIATLDVSAIYCLGDVVGYGPDPLACMAEVTKVCEPEKMIMGNHDYAVIHEPIGFNKSARRAANWTRGVVKPGLFSLFGPRRRRWNWLSGLPTTFSEDDGKTLFVHASPRQHLEEYILEEMTRGISYTGEDPKAVLDENFDLVQHTCFIGHTHRPGVVTDDHAWHSLDAMDYFWQINDQKTMINIGSVGQPRDGDPRACYVIWDGEGVEWRRVEYDVEKVRTQILNVDDLEDRLGERLLTGA